MDIGSGKNFAIIAKLSSQWLLGFRDPSVAQLIYKKGEECGGGGGGGAFIFIQFLLPEPPLPPSEFPALSLFAMPCLHASCLARVALVPSPIAARAYCSHAQPCPTLACAASSAHCQCRRCLCRRLSPLPGSAEPWSSLYVCAAYCLLAVPEPVLPLQYS